MNTIIAIDIDRIQHHPQNPRKDLGDLTELAESIRARGVMQNLTVTPGATDDLGGIKTYTAVIGTRRLEAAKLAGLTKVPCAVVEMDERTQLATMLAENMQRADLTLPEEVEGIQMMLDLGETVASVADITGLSETTVRRRAKLAEYDKGALAGAVQRGATIEDYVKLEKVKSVKERNALLQKIGTRDFNWAVKDAVSLQESVERRPALEKAFAEIKAKEIAHPEQYSGKYRTIQDFQGNIIPEDWSWPTDSDKTKYFSVVGDRFSTLLVQIAAAGKGKAPKETDKQKALKERLAALERITAQAKELRETWIKAFTPKKADSPKILRMLCLAASLANSMEIDTVAELTGVTFPEDSYTLEFEDVEVAAAESGWDKLAVVLAYAAFEDEYDARFYNRSTGEFCRKNSVMPTLYASLSALGYPVSAEEKALCDGTHELYAKPEIKE
jgi:ParB family chromosome partitioning protein